MYAGVRLPSVAGHCLPRSSELRWLATQVGPGLVTGCETPIEKTGQNTWRREPARILDGSEGHVAEGSRATVLSLLLLLFLKTKINGKCDEQLKKTRSSCFCIYGIESV